MDTFGKRFVAGLSAWLVSATVVWSQAPVTTASADQLVAVSAATELRASVAERVEREMAAQKIVGLAVGIARGQKVILTGAYGFEDREAGVKASDETMFRWASVSKPMTAVVAMQLAEAGKLDLDADVRTLVPEFSEKPSKITSRQLLTHQGGIVHYSNGPVIKTERDYGVDHPFEDVVVALDMFKDSPLVCEPGSKHSYTTHGYMLLGAVVQRAAGEEFAALVHRRIAEPMGMTTLRPDYQWEAIPHRAKGYRRGKDGEIVPSTDTDVSWKLAGGGWISSAGDMARFGSGMLGTKLVSADTRAQMWTAQPTRDGVETDYGLGFGVRERDGRLEISHSGAQEKAATFLLILPEPSGDEGGVVVAVMCNTEGSKLDGLSRDLARLVTTRAAVGGEPGAK
jgi:CubicO group peptidase (beta-lactamase class C family)